MGRGGWSRERGGERCRHHRRRRRCRGGQLKSKSSQQCKFITGLSKSTARKKASEECSGLHLWLPSGIRGRACSQHLQPSEPYAISAAIAHTWTRPNPTNVDQTLAAGRSNSTRSKVRLASLVMQGAPDPPADPRENETAENRNQRSSTRNSGLGLQSLATRAALCIRQRLAVYQPGAYLLTDVDRGKKSHLQIWSSCNFPRAECEGSHTQRAGEEKKNEK